MIEFPGSEEAARLGYHLHSYAGADKDGIINTAIYIKGDTFLTVKREGNELTAQLERYFYSGIIRCTTGTLSFPHKRFPRFEAMLAALKEQ